MEILNKYFDNKILGAVFLMVILINISCEKEAQVKIPETEPKPVLVCFISPEDSMIRVELTNSVPLYTKNSKQYPYRITNAAVTISDGSSSKNIPLIQDTIGYQLHTKFFPIKAGGTYQLEVKIPDGRTLSAKTTVPAENFPTFNFSLKKNLIDSSEFGVNYEFVYNLNWNDVPSVVNYYRAVIYNLNNDTTIGDTIAQPFNEIFENDLGKDGASFNINGQGNIFYVPGSPSPFNGSSYIAYLMLCNKAYFDYHKDLYMNNDDNPFVESKINFSNIEGGIGCFGAYRLAKKRF